MTAGLRRPTPCEAGPVRSMRASVRLEDSRSPNTHASASPSQARAALTTLSWPPCGSTRRRARIQSTGERTSFCKLIVDRGAPGSSGAAWSVTGPLKSSRSSRSRCLVSHAWRIWRGIPLYVPHLHRRAQPAAYRACRAAWHGHQHLATARGCIRTLRERGARGFSATAGGRLMGRHDPAGSSGAARTPS